VASWPIGAVSRTRPIPPGSIRQSGPLSLKIVDEAFLYGFRGAVLLCAALVLCGAGVATVMLETTDMRARPMMLRYQWAIILRGHPAPSRWRTDVRSACGEETRFHLRQCLSCGHVGCCDSSENRHATKHFWSSQHPIVSSADPGEDWRWCYVHEIAV